MRYLLSSDPAKLFQLQRRLYFRRLLLLIHLQPMKERSLSHQLV
jgi:hypothetical protein